MATMEEQRDASLEAAIHEAGKVVALRKQRDELLKALQFVLEDQNSTLDYETRLIVEHAINDAAIEQSTRESAGPDKVCEVCRLGKESNCPGTLC